MKIKWLDIKNVTGEGDYHIDGIGIVHVTTDQYYLYSHVFPSNPEIELIPEMSEGEQEYRIKRIDEQ